MTSAPSLPDDLISLSEAAQLIGCTRTTLGRWIDRGMIPGWRRGWVRFVRRSDVLAQVQRIPVRAHERTDREVQAAGEAAARRMGMRS